MDAKELTVAVGAVIEDDRGKILLVKHVPERGGYWQGKWICPGGRLHLGEGMEEAARREIMEETHLEVLLTEPLVPFERIVKSKGETQMHVIYIDYLAKVVGGELMPDSDIGEGMWVEKERIPDIWQDLHEDTQRLLKIARVV